MTPGSIIHGSCEDLSALSDESVGLTVTSPPYWNAIDYDVHSQSNGEWYRSRKYSEGYQAYAEYLDWLARIMEGIYRKTKAGGFACIVIGTVLFEKRHYPVPFDLVARLTRDDAPESPKWHFHQDIIWHKVTGGVKRAGVLIQNPYPGNFYPNIMTEYILIFRKPGISIAKEASDERREESKVPITRLFTNEIANTVWHVAPVPPGQLPHPCPFPEEIPHRLIQLYSYRNDLVLDPFCGIGTTLKVARHLNRRYIGYELHEKYIGIATERIQEPLRLREGQLVAEFAKIALNAPLSAS